MGYPYECEVMFGVQFGDANECTGNYCAPSTATVLCGTFFGACNGTEGTLNPIMPTEAQVLCAVNFGIYGECNGTYNEPDCVGVLTGYYFGPGGLYEGTATIPDECDVATGVCYGVVGGLCEGSLTASSSGGYVMEQG
jgi:hypothetical protein